MSTGQVDTQNDLPNKIKVYARALVKKLKREIFISKRSHFTL
jgi:hypothetical protein